MSPTVSLVYIGILGKCSCRLKPLNTPKTSFNSSIFYKDLNSEVKM